MADSAQVIEVGWEYEVPLTDVIEARNSLAAELEAYYHAPVADLTDKDVARLLVRRSHPTTRYVRLQGAVLFG
jgi:hypothetical protein